MGTLSLLQADATAARETFARLKDLRGLALAEHDLGHLAQSKQALDELIATHAKDSPYDIATVYAWIGDHDQAFVWLDKALSQHQGAVVLKSDPLLRGLRDDPRYAALLKELKLPE
jgi:serine/threonine-protein kinase